MNKKIITISVIILILLAHKFIIVHITILAMEKWINKDIQIKKFNISYNESKIILNKVKILNKADSSFKHVFLAEKIEIKFEPKSIFSKLIVVKNIEIENPIMNIFFEISDKKKEIINDNIGVLKNLNNKKNPKIYSKKIIDINFIVMSLKLDEFIVNIYKSDTQSKMAIKLSNIHFAPFGNEKGYQHYKDIFKIILMDIAMQIPNNRFRQKVLKKYNIL
tara:strand:- start:76 stop:735 length:660 start_codon:yes stop_codon:yes gene_type:complete